MTGTEWAVDRIVSITDGDTLRLVRSRTTTLDQLDLTARDNGPTGRAIRLVWVNTPERGQDGHREARLDLTIWLEAHQLAGVPLRVVCYQTDSFGRILGDILDAHGYSCSQWLMIEKGWPAWTA